MKHRLPDHDGSRKEVVLNIGEPADDVVHTDNIMLDGINYSYEICIQRIPSAENMLTINEKCAKMLLYRQE
ncbi:MAG: hypothetical protein IKG82_15010 [Oscillospiraceae bacterium]|nr:hypothetical protein [Oscillospiraceae bacterium]